MNQSNPFADLDEGPLSGTTGPVPTFGAGTHAARYQQEHDNAVIYGKVERKTVEEKCPKCNGSGRFISYTGRDCGACFTCKGKGVKYFSTTQVERQKAKEQRAAREDRKMAAREAAFAAAHPAEWAYISASPRDDFRHSCYQTVVRYGDLTEGRMAAIQRSIARNQERAAAAQARVEAAPTVDASSIKTVLDRAHSRGLRKPQLRFTDFTFQRAGDESKNPGAVYVVSSAKEYLGKITAEGKLLLRREATQHEQAVLKVCENPEAAADLYGQETGSCSCCGRELTREESVQRGIGPICYAKYFA